ncbi:cell growth regulator with EF hand domain protein 1 [Corvus moneduloides]|uniref:cell growth regulator with EF hand domain protein 1 n=1 Tax=Corvus moneduloides TaxID=1196302 RepID=UPI001362B402|nr:cell growth regulator with EF hand domain protein 1 [Corvus moneduloides]
MRDQPRPHCPCWCSGSRCGSGAPRRATSLWDCAGSSAGLAPGQGGLLPQEKRVLPALPLPLNWSMKAELSMCGGGVGLGLRASCWSHSGTSCALRGLSVPSGSCQWHRGCPEPSGPVGPVCTGTGRPTPSVVVLLQGSVRGVGDTELGWPGSDRDHGVLRGGFTHRHGPALAVTTRPSLVPVRRCRVPVTPALPCVGLNPSSPRAGQGRARDGRGRSWARWQCRDVSDTWPRGGAGGADTRMGLARGRGMRNPPAMLILLLLGPAAWAAPRAGRSRPESPVATIVDLHPDPLSPESPVLLLLWSAVRSLRPPEQDVEAMTREQALLYLFVLHDHDQSRRLDGLELLQLLGTVLAQAGGQPDPDMVAALVDQALARQDLNGDGLLDPSELLDPPEVLLPGQGKGPPGQPPLEQQPGAVPGEGTEMPGQDLGLRSPGQAAIEAGDPQTGAPEDEAPKVESVKVESSSAEALEAEEAPEAKAPSTDAMEEEEAPEAEAPEGQGGPAWRDPGEG